MLTEKIKEYQEALEAFARLSKQEVAIKSKVVAAHSRLSYIRGELRDLELDITSTLHSKTV